jgi:hypothetical protein
MHACLWLVERLTIRSYQTALFMYFACMHVCFSLNIHMWRTLNHVRSHALERPLCSTRTGPEWSEQL